MAKLIVKNKQEAAIRKLEASVAECEGRAAGENLTSSQKADYLRLALKFLELRNQLYAATHGLNSKEVAA